MQQPGLYYMRSQKILRLNYITYMPHARPDRDSSYLVSSARLPTLAARVPQRATFKLRMSTHIQNLIYPRVCTRGPDYLTELCIQSGCTIVNRSRRRLRAAAVGDLIIPRTTTSFGDRAFAHGPHAWNSHRSSEPLPAFKKLYTSLSNVLDSHND